MYIIASEARKYMSKPSEVKPMVRKIREIMNRLLASHVSIPLVKSSIHGLQVVLHGLLDYFLVIVFSLYVPQLLG